MSRKFIIILLIAAISICNATVYSSFSDVTEANFQDEINVISGLEIMNGYGGNIFKPEQEITRAEFAQIMANLCRINFDEETQSWVSQYLGSEDKELDLITDSAKEQIFSDVPPNHWAIDIINAVYSYGIMSGADNNTFNPDRGITYNEALKTLINLLGYNVKAEIKGGYPIGYQLVSDELKITKGNNKSNQEIMRRCDIAKLIYNCLEVDVLVKTSFGENTKYEARSGENLLSEVLGIYTVEGTMTGNENTYLTNADKMRTGNVRIGSNDYELSDNMYDAKDYIGMKVKAYYIGEEPEDYTIVYVAPSRKQTVHTISAEEFLSFENNKLNYYQNGNKNINIAVGSPMIYNGSALASYNNDTFDFQSGEIKVIESDEPYGNIIVVNNYEPFFVSYINTVDKELFNKIAANKEESIISLDENTVKDLRYRITDLSGKRLSFEDLSSGNILSVAKSGTNYDIKKSDKTITGTVSEVTSDNDDLLLTIEGSQYTVCKSYLSSDTGKNFIIGDSGTFYLDAFGKIAWYESLISKDINIAYIIKSQMEKGLSGMLEIKVFDFKSKKVASFDTERKISFTNENGDSSTVLASDLETVLKSNNCIVNYKINEKGKINDISIPLAKNNSKNKNGLRTIFETSDDEMNPYYYGNFYYKISVKTFGGAVYMNDTTQILQIPSDTTDYEEYRLVTPTAFENDKTYRIKAYTSEEDSPLAQFVVTNALQTNDILMASDKAVVVTKIVDAIDEDGLRVKKLSGYQHNANVVLYSDYKQIDANNNSCTNFDLAQDPFKTKINDLPVYYKVEVGDVIRITKGLKENYVDRVQILYKANMENHAWTNGLKGYLVGSNGFNNSSVLNGNPYALNDAETALTSASIFNTGTFRVMYGFVYSKKGNYIKVTTQDILKQQFDENNTNYSTTYYNGNSFTSTNVVYNDKTVTAVKGGMGDIKSYEDVGKDCSRVIAITRLGDVTQLIIINDLR